jgi:Protein of unknown function (DUF4239)
MDESIYTASSSWLYRQHPICLVAVLMVVMTVTAEIGFRLGRRWHPRTDDARRGHLASVMGSLLGLLALLLSFTFAMSANRYDTRRQMVMSEANALGTLYLQSSVLPDAPRKAFKQILRQYVAFRAQAALLRHDASAKETAQAIAQAEDLQDQMLNVIKTSAELEPPAKSTDAMLRGLIEAVSVYRSRVFALESRVPDSIIWLILAGSATAMAAVGLSGGLGNHRGVPARVILTILLCGTIYVVLDLDRPHEGLIKISQTPILHLSQILDRDAEAKP